MPKNMKYDAVSSKAGVKKTNQDGGSILAKKPSDAAKQLESNQVKEGSARKGAAKGMDHKKGGAKYADKDGPADFKGGLHAKNTKHSKSGEHMGAKRMGYTQTPGAARKKMGDVVQGIMRNGPADLTGKKHSHNQEELNANREEILSGSRPPIAGRDKLLSEYSINAPKFGNKTASEHLTKGLKELKLSQRGLDSIKMTKKPNDMFFRDNGELKMETSGSPKTDPKAEALKAAQMRADSNKIAKTDKIKASQLYGNMARAEHAGMKAHATTGNLTQILGKGLPPGENTKTTEFFVEESIGMKPKTF